MLSPFLVLLRPSQRATSLRDVLDKREILKEVFQKPKGLAQG